MCLAKRNTSRVELSHSTPAYIGVHNMNVVLLDGDSAAQHLQSGLSQSTARMPLTSHKTCRMTQIRTTVRYADMYPSKYAVIR